MIYKYLEFHPTTNVSILQATRPASRAEEAGVYAVDPGVKRFKLLEDGTIREATDQEILDTDIALKGMNDAIRGIRRRSYPRAGDQLDAIWKILEGLVDLAAAGDPTYLAVKKVKEDYPKDAPS